MDSFKENSESEVTSAGVSHNFTFDNINWELMRQLRVFESGRIIAQPIPKDDYKPKKKPKEIPMKYRKNFQDVPTLVPVIVKQSYSLEKRYLQGPGEYEENKYHDNQNTPLVQIETEDSQIMTLDGKDENIRIQKNLSKLDLQVAADKQEFQKYVEIYPYRQIKYHKPLALIYNPASGKKRDKKFDSWFIPYGLDIDKYSAIVAVGGDGTAHEVVNGMMHRLDKKILPVAFLPNGTGNDTIRQFSAHNLETALDFLIKGQAIKYDLTMSIADSETEEEVPAEEKSTRIKYELVNNGFGLFARANHHANSRYKRCCCNPYIAGAIQELAWTQTDFYTIEIDGEIVFKDQPAVIIMVSNSKFGGKGQILSPFSVVNDGLVEVSIFPGNRSIKEVISFQYESAYYKGLFVYNPKRLIYRGKTVKIEHRNFSTKRNPRSKTQKNGAVQTLRMDPDSNGEKENLLKQKDDREKIPQRYHIDGEDLTFKDFVKFECLYGALEIIVDYDFIMKEQQIFYQE
ncbi:diacylglycerol kinase [Stylonychia lemnae]|uniref:Diacylglycerol kinase n=1 Tax=Stylonychia lemnae TaxID=5949 RepID=A0A078AGP7_STYLE|nr:diacylglycerol kinase [Stylonychia lemnae]|eukprot:CDW81011.1 diacylglycerol kinase [Stylonychia lemnae]